MLAEYMTGKFGKMLLGNDKIMVVLHRLDRLTEEEARMTVSQTLEVIRGLVSNMKVVMDGTLQLTKLPPFVTCLVQTARSQQSVFVTLSVSSSC
jgi:hypothetical protein